MYLNKAFVIGNITRDPELKALPSGSKVCNLSVATNRSYKDKDGSKVDTTEYHNIVAFAKLGELAGQYLKKGQQVFVEGRIQTRSWDGQDGQKKYRTEIIADNIQFGMKPLGGSSGSAGGSSKSDSKSEEPAPMESGEKVEYPQEEINPDDIPF
jgi:single-strand DNA-binding protein